MVQITDSKAFTSDNSPYVSQRCSRKIEMSALCKVEMSSLPFRGVIREAEIGSDHDERTRATAYRGAFRGRSEETDGAISGGGAGDQHPADTTIVDCVSR